MKKSKDKKRGIYSTIVFTIVIFLIIFSYTVIRYNVIKGVDHSPLSLYILNKAIAVTSVALIGLCFIIGPLARIWPKTFETKKQFRKSLGLIGFGFAAIHAIISLLLLNPLHYPKFFLQNGQLTTGAQISLLFGVLALLIFSAGAISSMQAVKNTMKKKNWYFVQKLGYLAFALVMLHVLVMGWEGWLKPETWPGGMPPLTLISFAIIAIVLIMRGIVMISPKLRGE